MPVMRDDPVSARPRARRLEWKVERTLTTSSCLIVMRAVAMAISIAMIHHAIPPKSAIDRAAVV